MLTADNVTFGFAEVVAWDAPYIEIESTAISNINYSSMTKTGGSSEQRLFNWNNPITINIAQNCPQYSMQTSSEMLIDLPAGSKVSDVFL